MGNREQYKRLIQFLASSVILALHTGIFIYVWFYFYADIGANYFVRGNYVIIAQYAVMVLAAHKLCGGFRVGYQRIFEVFFTLTCAVIAVNAFMYFEMCLIGRWAFMTNLWPMLIMTAVDILVLIPWVFLSRMVITKLYPPRRMVLVYGERSPYGLAAKISSRKDKYTVCETVSEHRDRELIQKKILEYRCAILADINIDTRNALVKFCYENDIRCYCVPKISDVMLMSADNIHLFDTSLMLMRNRGLTADQRLFKRIFDVVASALAIVIASPIMAIIALCIKLYDHGPVIFTQDRLTRGGEVFRVYKFRSMRVQKPGGQYVMTRQNDDRITPVGKIIRRLHLDELPQLFNIFKGEMSFVGPRPETPGIAKEYCEVLPEFSYRLKVKAGLTGYAQVYGKYNTTPYDKLKMDLTYIENYSFLLDIKLMLLTLKAMFEPENTEGIAAWQTTAAKDAPEKSKKG